MKRKTEPEDGTPGNPGDSDPYGYGLTLTLDAGQCEALGIKSPPVAGAVYMVHARAFTQSVSLEAEPAGKPGVRVSLQITDMSLEAQGRSASDVATSLYG